MINYVYALSYTKSITGSTSVRTHCLGPCVVYKFDLSLVLIALIMGILNIAIAAELNFLFMGNSRQLSIIKSKTSTI